MRSNFPYHGVIFDLDGLIFDTQTPVHARAEVEVLAGYGVTVDPVALSKKYAGISTKKVFRELAPHLDAEKLYIEKWQRVREILVENPAQPIEGIIELIDFLRRRLVPIAIASASPRWYIDMLLKQEVVFNNKRIQLRDYFWLYYVSAEEVFQPKPAPDVFIKAAEILEVSQVECLVIGDGISDMQGALAAKMDGIFLGAFSNDVNHPRIKVCETGVQVYQHINNLFL